MSYIIDLYHDEIRDGCLVMSDLKKVWNRQLEIWAEVDRICRKHGITYWAGYGTLIGAARHKGFIPWDDDFDLCMARPDYNRFCTLLDDELTAGLEIRFKGFSVIKLGHSQTTAIESSYAPKNDSPQCLSIDIFALDIALDGTTDAYLAANALNELTGTAYNFGAIVKHVQNGGWTVNDLEIIETVHDIADFKDQCKFLNIYAELLFNQSSTFYWIEDFARDMNRTPFQKSWFDETIYLPFETVELPAPKKFDEVLTAYYGDWRTPVHDGQSRLGIIHSADISYKDFLRLTDIENIRCQKISRRF